MVLCSCMACALASAHDQTTQPHIQTIYLHMIPTTSICIYIYMLHRCPLSSEMLSVAQHEHLTQAQHGAQHTHTHSSMSTVRCRAPMPAIDCYVYGCAVYDCVAAQPCHVQLTQCSSGFCFSLMYKSSIQTWTTQRQPQDHLYLHTNAVIWEHFFHHTSTPSSV